MDIKEKILKLKEEKNAVIMAHYYTDGEIQDIADCIGDSLYLAQQAAKTDADIIVLCGVHFMGETAKILCPDKTVLVPDMNAGCSLADSCPADEFKKFIDQHPGHTVISYVNTTANVKALTDIVVTSSNAKQIVESFPKDEKIIFGPDRNLGNYINSITSDATEFLVATESGILHEMKKKAPNKVFIPVPPEDSVCACNNCSYMKLNTLEKLYNCLVNNSPEVLVDSSIIERAKLPIVRMLEISQKLGL